jgi:hypothetical protein
MRSTYGPIIATFLNFVNTTYKILPTNRGRILSFFVKTVFTKPTLLALDQHPALGILAPQALLALIQPEPTQLALVVLPLVH